MQRGNKAASADWREPFERATSHVISRYSVLKEKHSHVCMRAYTRQNKPVFVKYYKKPHSIARARAEMDTLQHCYFSMSSDGSRFGVPEPYGFFSDEYGGAAITCQWIKHWTVHSWFKLGILFDSVTRIALRQSACWLRHYHDISMNETKSLGCFFDLDLLNSNLEITVDRLLRGDFHKMCSPAQIKDATELFCSIRHEKVLHSKLHGDFAPQNLFMSAHSTLGFDFADAKNGPVLLDIRSFLTRMIYYSFDSNKDQLGTIFRRNSDIFWIAIIQIMLSITIGL